MSPTQITRWNDSTSQTVVFTNSTSTTGGFNMHVYSGAMLLCTATSTGSAVTLTFLVKETESSSTAFTAYDSGGTVVSMAVQANRAYPLPDALFAATHVLATTNTGTATVKVLLKG